MVQVFPVITVQEYLVQVIWHQTSNARVVLKMNQERSHSVQLPWSTWEALRHLLLVNPVTYLNSSNFLHRQTKSIALLAIDLIPDLFQFPWSHLTVDSIPDNYPLLPSSLSFSSSCQPSLKSSTLQYPSSNLLEVSDTILHWDLAQHLELLLALNLVLLSVLFFS